MAWPESSQVAYNRLLSKASAVHILYPGGFAVEKMHGRNKWMVDQATHLLALWDGSSSGTGNCVRYAESRGVPVIHCWHHYLGMFTKKE